MHILEQGCATVSLLSRIEITTEQLLELKVKCQQYFRSIALLLPSMVTPTVWTLGHVVPRHTEQLFQIYHKGLGTVTMEGREAKHIVLKKLSENSSSKNQWFDIFQHEFVMLIWLPENGFTTCQYKASKYRILHGKCARTVFTHKLWRIRNRTSERSEQVRFLIQNNECVNTVQSTFHVVLCLLYTY